MKRTWDFWRYIFGLAWRESVAAVKKRAGILAAALAALIAVAFLLPGAFDIVGRVFAAAATAFAASLVVVLWKMVSIPAKLHVRSLTRAEYRKIAETLDHREKLGQALRFELVSSVTYTPMMNQNGQRYINVLSNQQNVDLTAWCQKCGDWFWETEQALRKYSNSEAYMFRSIEPAEPLHHPQFALGEELFRLEGRLRKLRLIVGRAYQLSTDQADQAPSIAATDQTV